MNKIEEQFYAMAAQEISSKSVAPGVMAKALVDADGDEKKTILNYIRLRVAQLKEEFVAEQVRRQQEEAERQRQESDRQEPEADRQRKERAERNRMERWGQRGSKAQAKILSLREAAQSKYGQLYNSLVAAYDSRLAPSEFESTSQYLERVARFQRWFEQGR